MKRQKEREEDKKIEKYFDIHKLQNKYKENDKDKIQQIIRRALVRDTLKEHERILKVLHRHWIVFVFKILYLIFLILSS
jgi:hypothetical protein